MEIEQELEDVLNCVESNSQTLQRLQKFEWNLLNLQSLSEMIEYILEAQDYFQLDYMGLCFTDTIHEISNYLEHTKFDFSSYPRLIFLEDKHILYDVFGGLMKPYLGSYEVSEHIGFFGDKQLPLESIAVIPLIRHGQHLGVLSLGSLDGQRFSATMATDFIEHMAAIITVCLENNLNYEAVKYESFIDPLTGVNNRRFFEQRLSEEISASQRSLSPFSCLFLDIDFFKKVNDVYGHQAGDKVLILVAKTIGMQLRKQDVLARFGGEEFITLLDGAAEETALSVAQRIVDSIQQLSIELDGKTIPVTISIGCVSYQPSKGVLAQSVHELGANIVRKADEALYLAKDGGRNQVISSGVISE